MTNQLTFVVTQNSKSDTYNVLVKKKYVLGDNWTDEMLNEFIDRGFNKDILLKHLDTDEILKACEFLLNSFYKI